MWICLFKNKILFETPCTKKSGKEFTGDHLIACKDNIVIFEEVECRRFAQIVSFK